MNVRSGLWRSWPCRLGPALLLVTTLPTELLAGQTMPGHPSPPDGAAIYRDACQHCHGVDGRGASIEQLSLPAIPDFTDCQFAPREPDGDWLAVILDGGPARAFDRAMPAMGDALTLEQAHAALGHVRSFCTEAAWPRGELNLPKALVTEKAFPEDEVIWLTTFAAEGPGAVEHKIVYEKRFGPRNQIEFVVPMAAHAREAGGWQGGIGDFAVGFKRVLSSDARRGRIMSVTGEMKLPTGNDTRGFGKGVAAFEPFLTFGQILPADSFVQLQGGVELPLERDRARDAFWRAVVGRTFTQGLGGRAWSPMLEVLGARELLAGEKAQWDLLPELQVSLSTRQHILFNVGVRIPLTNSGTRSTQILTYILWDTFDGGFFDGW